MRQSNIASSETTFVEFRRKVRDSELLALGVSQLLREIQLYRPS